MDLTVIDGGSPKKIKKKDADGRLAVFVDHMRSIEQSMSMVARMAEQIGWDELTKRALNNHRGILDTLGYVKHYRKQIIENLQSNVPNLQSIPGGKLEGEKTDESE